MTRLAAPVAIAAGLAALFAVGAGRSQAGPVVAVRARTAITVEPIRRVRGATTVPPRIVLSVKGRLHERGSDRPVASAKEMTVSLDEQTLPVFPTDEGRFDIQFTTAGGRHRLSIDYPGDRRYEASHFSLPDLDVGKQPLVLSLRSPDQVQRARGPLDLEVQASDEVQPAQVPVSIRFGSADAAELTEVGQVTTDELGRAPFSLPVERLGPPGPKMILVRFAGDALYDPAEAEATLVVESATRLQFSIGSAEVAFEGRVRGRGRLVDDLGAGLAGQPVSLVAEDQSGRRTLDESLTDANGRFALDAPASELGPGGHMVQAVFESPRPYLEMSRSSPARVTVAERRPVPVGYSLAAFVATATSIVAFVALRTRPWTRLLGRLRGGSAAPAAAAVTEKRDPPPRTGLALARPGLVSTLRRPHDHGFTGVVADAVTGAAIAGARVSLGGGSVEAGDTTVDVEEHTTEVDVAAELSPELAAADRAAAPDDAATDEAGRFAFEELAPGEYRAEVSSPGYVTERFAVIIPHRGELRDARVDLLPVRERIFQLYREAAESLLPRSDLWGVWTPRQIVDHVRRSRPARALGDLTDHVEEKYFSARVPDEAELARTEARVAAARAEAQSASASGFDPT